MSLRGFEVQHLLKSLPFARGVRGISMSLSLNRRPGVQLLTPMEEKVIVQRILDLESSRQGGIQNVQAKKR